MTNVPIDAIANRTPQPLPGAPDNWKRFFTFSTDHKVIGIQYLVTSFTFFLVGGFFAMIIRGELITPEADLVDRTIYNAMFTMHGTVMLFLWMFPSLVGLANYLVPLMIGARDMAFPRLNAIAFWMVPVSATSLLRVGRRSRAGGPIRQSACKTQRANCLTVSFSGYWRWRFRAFRPSWVRSTLSPRSPRCVPLA